MSGRTSKRKASRWSASPPARRSDDGLKPLRYETLVDKVIQTLIEGAARGTILPGDRIVESDIAERLGISRVPIREAMRILESQGIVINEPFKGSRLTPVTRQRIDNLTEARIALETTAVKRAVANGKNGEAELAQLQRIIDELELMTVRRDAYGLATADAAFHRQLMEFSDNPVLAHLWEMLARQLTIIVGLSTLAKSMSQVVQEHQRLLDVFRSGDVTAISAELKEHIIAQNRAVDFVGLIDQRSVERGHVATVAGASPGRNGKRRSASRRRADAGMARGE